MKASELLMEKQITGLAGGRGGDLMELLDPPEDRQSNGAGVGRKEEILASYDFQPIRRSGFGLSPPASLDDSGGWGAPESTPMASHFGARVRFFSCRLNSRGGISDLPYLGYEYCEIYRFFNSV